MRITFLILIILYGVIELAFGIWMLADIEAVSEVFNASYTPSAAVFGVPLTGAIFAFTILTVIAFAWVYKKKAEGAVIGLLIGGWLIFAAILAYVKLNMLDSLLVDGIRGVLIFIISAVLLKKYKTLNHS